MITRVGPVRSDVRTDGSARGVRKVKCTVYCWKLLLTLNVMKSVTVTILKYPFTTVFFNFKNSFNLLYLLFLTMLKFKFNVILTMCI